MNQPFEKLAVPYGVPFGPVILRRATAEKLAQAMVGIIIDQKTDLTTPFLRGEGLNPCLVDLSQPRYRITGYRMDDDPTDLSRGYVVAICQEVT